MRVATFNVQNLRLRQDQGQPRLDPARDDDMDTPPQAARSTYHDRHLTADLLRRADADFVALQEVFDRTTLDFFHDRVFLRPGTRPYPFRHCARGNDGRGRNVAFMSRIEPRAAHSHNLETGRSLGLPAIPPDLRDRPIFRRDCLEVLLPDVAIYICHFKAPYPDAARAFAVRQAEAAAVRRIVERRFDDPGAARWIIAGDFNEPVRTGQNRAASAIAPLLEGFAIDLAARQPAAENWTYEIPSSHAHTRPDRILVSPALARAHPDLRPDVLRSPTDHNACTEAMPHASDHALVIADFGARTAASPVNHKGAEP